MLNLGLYTFGYELMELVMLKLAQRLGFGSGNGPTRELDSFSCLD